MPLCLPELPSQVYATRAIRAGEELVAPSGVRQDPDMLLLPRQQRLHESGYRCHLLDAMWLRLCQLAASLADTLVLSSRTAPAADRLRRALQADVKAYYCQQQQEQQLASSSSSGISKASPGIVLLLEEALSASLQKHPAVPYPSPVARLAQPPAEKQYRPVAAHQLPELSRSTDYSGLPDGILRELESAPEGQELAPVRACVPHTHTTEHTTDSCLFGPMAALSTQPSVHSLWQPGAWVCHCQGAHAPTATASPASSPAFVPCLTSRYLPCAP